MKIIHITDPHVRPPGQLVWGLDASARLGAVIDDVNTRHTDADLVAITGDLTHYGEPAAYVELASLLGRLLPPYRLMLGNHDRRAAFREIFKDHPVDENGFVQSALDAPGQIGRLLFLDTHEEGRIGGHLCERRLAWLRRQLSQAEHRPVVVFQHHPPLRVGAPHFDNICMAEPQAYLKMLREHPGGVRQVFFGHVHIPLSGTFPGNLPFTAGRGCTHQIVLDLEDPTVSWASGRPNYNVVMLDDDSLFVHAFDMIDTECIGTDSAPAGP